jgi:hypothetical protein
MIKVLEFVDDVVIFQSITKIVVIGYFCCFGCCGAACED